MWRHWPALLCVWIISATTSCLELTTLTVPTHVPLGTRASLSCRWQLSPSDVLYSVKWYKDGREFFRHVPRDTEPRRQFPLPGVHVEKSDASGSQLTLGPAVLETSGRYRCEVSGEKPLFPTVSEHADLLVVELPTSGPVITGLQTRYRIGEHIQVNCTSPCSRPSTRLSWYVNGEPAPIGAVGKLTTLVYPDGLESSSLGMDYEVNAEDFVRGAVKVKCLATIGSIYWRSNEESALEMRFSSFSPRSSGSGEPGRFYEVPRTWRKEVVVRNYQVKVTGDKLVMISVCIILYRNICIFCV